MLVTSGHRFSKVEKRKRLKENYDQELDGFLCEYTGLRLEEVNQHDPHYLVYDHLIPGQEKLATAAFWVNDSKGWLTQLQFWKVIGELTNHIRTGGEFDKDVLTKMEWKRAMSFGRAVGRRVA